MEAKSGLHGRFNLVKALAFIHKLEGSCLHHRKPHCLSPSTGSTLLPLWLWVSSSGKLGLPEGQVEATWNLTWWKSLQVLQVRLLR